MTFCRCSLPLCNRLTDSCAQQSILYHRHFCLSIAFSKFFLFGCLLKTNQIIRRFLCKLSMLTSHFLFIYPYYRLNQLNALAKKQNGGIINLYLFVIFFILWCDFHFFATYIYRRVIQKMKNRKDSPYESSARKNG